MFKKWKESSVPQILRANRISFALMETHLAVAGTKLRVFKENELGKPLSYYPGRLGILNFEDRC